MFSKNGVNRSLRAYLRDIGNVALLTAEEERELARRIAESGDTKARAKFIEANIRLVVWAVRKYSRLLSGASRDQGYIPEFLDLVQEGSIGLMRAVDKLNPEIMGRFSTYAVWWVHQGINRALNDGYFLPFRQPAYVGELGMRVSRARKNMARGTGQYVTPVEVAEALGISLRIVKKVWRIPRTISFDDIVEQCEQGENSSHGQLKRNYKEWVLNALTDADHTMPLEEMIIEERRIQVRKAFRILLRREQRVIELRFGFIGGRPHTLEEVGMRLKPNITRERVRQIEVTALRKLRESLRRMRRVS